MGRVDLTYDPDKIEFFAALMIQPESGGLINAEFLVDTGSNSCSLNLATAENLNLDPNTLEREQVAGVNGITSEPVYRKPLILYLNENLDKIVVKSVRVYVPVARKVTKKYAGGFKKHAIMEAPLPNILGLDALTNVNGGAASLHVDMRTKTAYIEW
jgi:hypothetical protein